MRTLPEAPTFRMEGGARPPSNVEDILASIQFATPIYGGGVEGGVSDTTVTPIRASAIRGMLRWWWRATRGARFTSVAELKAAEDCIWGSTNEKSLVVVEVEKSTLAPGLDAVRNEGGRRIFEQPGYALFPAQSDTGARKIHKSGNFELRISVQSDSSLLDEVQPALNAWIWYGGVGARTRRGLGSMWCAQRSPVVVNGALQLPANGPATYNRGPAMWPMLPGARYILGSRCSSAVDAWTRAIDLYKTYRQNRHGDGKGRSYWQEPDAIRRLRRRTSRMHSTPLSTVDVFPRAQFGLPIVFHFKDSRDGDPFDNTLELNSKDSDRMASPVIVKALVTGEKEAYPLILAMNAPAVPIHLKLKQKDQPDLVVSQGGIDAIEYLLQTAEAMWNTKRKVLPV